MWSDPDLSAFLAVMAHFIVHELDEPDSPLSRTGIFHALFALFFLPLTIFICPDLILSNLTTLVSYHFACSLCSQKTRVLNPLRSQHNVFTTTGDLFQSEPKHELYSMRVSVRNMVFFELFLCYFSRLSMLLFPSPLLPLSFTHQEKTIRVLLIPRRSRAQHTTITDDPIERAIYEA